MKTLAVLKTVTGESVEEDDKEGERLPPISRAGRGDLIVPGVVAAVSGVVLLIGYLVGASGLFPDLQRLTSDAGEVTIGFGDRMVGLGRFVVLALVWTGCGLAGLVALAAINGTKIGDLRLAAMRVLAMVVTMRLLTLIDLEQRAFEWIIEAPTQAAVFLALSTVLFSFTPRDGLMYGLVTLASFLGLWILGSGLVWAT